MFEWDHNAVYLDGKKRQNFTISSRNTLANAVVISLFSAVDSDLYWEEALEQASQLEDQKIIWKFDFDLQKQTLVLTDQRSFQSFKLALSHFKKEIYPRFQDQSLGAILYEGIFDFASYFPWTDVLERNFFDQFEDSAETDMDWFKKCFWTRSFVDYFRMLSYELPDSMAAILCFDCPENNLFSESYHLFSKEYFEHFLLAVRGGAVPFEALCWEKGESHLGFYDAKYFESGQAMVGIVFPEQPNSSELKVLNRLILKLINEKGSFRILEERFITEKWDGLNVIFSFKEMSSFMITRALQGFQAAGGMSIVLNENFTESDLMDRGRGI